MRAHVITDGKVSNTIVVNSLDIIPGLIDAAIGGVIGDLWDGTTFTTPPAPPAPVPQQVDMAQARLALLGAGLYGNVQSAIDAMPDPQKTAAQIMWDFRPTVERTNSLLTQLATALGLTDAQIDALFVAAAQL